MSGLNLADLGLDVAVDDEQPGAAVDLAGSPDWLAMRAAAQNVLARSACTRLAGLGYRQAVRRAFQAVYEEPPIALLVLGYSQQGGSFRPLLRYEHATPEQAHAIATTAWDFAFGRAAQLGDHEVALLTRHYDPTDLRCVSCLSPHRHGDLHCGCPACRCEQCRY